MLSCGGVYQLCNVCLLSATMIAVQHQQTALRERAEAGLSGMQARESKLNTEPLPATKQQDSASQKRRPESPKIAALKAAFVAAGSSGCGRI